MTNLLLITSCIYFAISTPTLYLACNCIYISACSSNNDFISGSKTVHWVMLCSMSWVGIPHRRLQWLILHAWHSCTCMYFVNLTNLLLQLITVWRLYSSHVDNQYTEVDLQWPICSLYFVGSMRKLLKLHLEMMTILLTLQAHITGIHTYMCREFVNKFCMFLNIDVYSIPKFKKVSNTNFMKST